jgi:uncharacterized protein with FMN-binding domain
MGNHGDDRRPTASERGRSLWQSRGARSKAGLVGLSSAAILSVYAAGYFHTSAGDSVAASAAIAEVLATSAPASTPTTAPATATTTRPGTSQTTPSTRAQPTATPTVAAGTAAVAYQDGTYTGTGSSRHGSIGVTVVVSGGKITSAEISSCQTKYPCSKVSSLPAQVVARQAATVNYVSGATDSSKAYASAVAAALTKARV